MKVGETLIVNILYVVEKTTDGIIPLLCITLGKTVFKSVFISYSLSYPLINPTFKDMFKSFVKFLPIPYCAKKEMCPKLFLITPVCMSWKNFLSSNLVINTSPTFPPSVPLY